MHIVGVLLKKNKIWPVNIFVISSRRDSGGAK